MPKQRSMLQRAIGIYWKVNEIEYWKVVSRDTVNPQGNRTYIVWFHRTNTEWRYSNGYKNHQIIQILHVHRPESLLPSTVELWSITRTDAERAKRRDPSQKDKGPEAHAENKLLHRAGVQRRLPRGVVTQRSSTGRPEANVSQTSWRGTRKVLTMSLIPHVRTKWFTNQ